MALHVALALALLAALVFLVAPERDPRPDPPSAVPVPPSASPLADPSRPGVVIATSSTIDLPDPFLLAWHGKHYLYVSSAFGAPPSMNVPMMVASHTSQSDGALQGDFGRPIDALPTLPSWAFGPASGGKVWAPDVVRIGGRFVMYSAPSLRHGPTAITHCIGVATAGSPSGPFVPEPGPPIVCQLELGGDIDPQVFVDPHGPNGPKHPYYLLWKSDNNVLPTAGPDTAWAAPLRDDGLALSGPPVPILTVHQPWEQPFLEAPQMVTAPDGSYWLLFSGGAGFWLPGSIIGIAKCAGPLGGCTDVRTTPLIASNAQGEGPGEETTFVSPKSGVWILYSAWHTGTLGVFRPVEAAHLGWNSQGPELLEPGRGPLAG